MANRYILSYQLKIWISLDERNTYYLAGCAENGTFSQNTTFAEKRCQEDDGSVTKAPSEDNPQIDFDGVVPYDVPTGQSIEELAINRVKWGTGVSGDPKKEVKGFFGNYTENKNGAEFLRYNTSFVNSQPIEYGIES